MSRVVNVSIIILLYIVVMVIAAIFVYKDAKRRGMNEVVWGLIGLLTPFLLGVFLYLICRNPLTELKCPKCGAFVDKTMENCPNCNSRLLTQCPVCHFPVQKGWKTCPQCGNEYEENYQQPILDYKKDSTLAPIIFIILILIVCISGVVNMFVGDGQKFSGYGGYTGMYNISADDLRKNDEIAEWLDSCDEKEETMCVLYSTEDGTCILYVKNSTQLLYGDSDISYYDKKIEANFFVKESEWEDEFGYDFFLYDMEKMEKLDVYGTMNGEDVDVDVSYTDAEINRETWRE